MTAPNVQTTDINIDTLAGNAGANTLTGVLSVEGDLNVSGSLKVAGANVLTSFVLPAYTLATLPPVVEDALIDVSDATSTGLCLGRGTDWLDVMTGAPVA